MENDPRNRGHSEEESVKGSKVAVVTGGATGIGASCCKALAKKGFVVGVHYNRSVGAAESLVSELGEAFLLKADLARVDEIDVMLDELRKRANRVDVLVNNAGISINADIHSMTLEQFDSQRWMSRGTWYLTKRILRLFMLRQNEGRIINISSVVASTGNAGQIPYTMEKAALEAFTKSLAKELSGRNILVNAVAPGFIDTEMTRSLPEDVRREILSRVPIGRMGTPEEVAEVVAFLATEGTYIHGTVVHVNGGLYGG